jgi:amidohydrolase
MPGLTASWFLEKATAYLTETIRLRRHMHQHPELSFEEYKTVEFVQNTLAGYGIQGERIGTTGFTSTLSGANSDGGVLALRADMDALPIQEAADRSYHSVFPGKMHACGHDAHTAILISVARILFEIKENWNGQVKLIFQPAEEKFPGGASVLIREGILDRPVPHAILGQHVTPELTTGKIGFRSGPFMASADEIYITIQGKTGHGAMPHTTIDPILIASHLVVALQQVVSRRNNPLLPSVLTIGKINSTGGATNIIPGEVKLEGTFRTFDESWRAEAKHIIKELAQGLVHSMGGTVYLDIKEGYPVVQNHSALIAELKLFAADILGPEHVIDLPMRTTAEDFGYYSHQLPAAFYRLGTARAGQEGHHRIHTPEFDIDEQALAIGVAYMAYASYQWLLERDKK